MFKRKEFTLIELIVVIAVLGILASIVIPNISGVQEKAQVAQTVSNIRNIQTAVDMYFVENESYPTNVQPTDETKIPIDYNLLNVDYLRDVPTDNLTYLVDYYGTVSVMGYTGSEDLPENNPPIKVNPPSIIANVDVENQKVYTDTRLSFGYELDKSLNAVVLAEKWTVDGEERSSAPNQIFSEGEHIITLSVRYEPKVRDVEEHWTEESVVKFKVVNPNKVKKLESGENHSFLITENGLLYSWGSNSSGILGDGTSANRLSPTLVPSLSNVKQVAGGREHTVALTEDGKVYTWGDNNRGQLGHDTKVTQFTPKLLEPLPNIKQVEAGTYTTFAITENGNVYGWGTGYLGNKRYSAGDTPTLISSLSNIKQISAGYSHTLALTESGEVYAWGDNSKYQLGDGTTNLSETPIKVQALPAIKQVAAGEYYSLALTEDGYIYAWGYNNSGQLGDGTITTREKPVKLSLISNVKHITVGQSHSLAVTEDGQIYSWGYNIYKQLGHDYTSTSRPTAIPTLAKPIIISQIAAGQVHSLALTDNGEVYAWGYNGKGQLGDGTGVNKYVPTKITLPKPN